MTPVVLFAYARPRHLRQTLACLKENRVPFIYAFSDGPKPGENSDLTAKVGEVRRILREIDWCEVSIVERTENLGLGRSILTGVAEVLTRHDSVIVFEDDLICVEGTYSYLAAALERYKADSRVMSVTGWTHPRIAPTSLHGQPYFDGRAECWVWGTWRRGWRGMEEDALTMIRSCEQRGLDPYAYGADLVEMARIEHDRNIWAVRFLYLHMLRRGLCLRPPHSLVEHIGFDAEATNTGSGSAQWANPPLRPCPSIPAVWPEPIEHPTCRALAINVYGSRPRPPSFGARLRRRMTTALPEKVRRVYRSLSSGRYLDSK